MTELIASAKSRIAIGCSCCFRTDMAIETIKRQLGADHYVDLYGGPFGFIYPISRKPEALKKIERIVEREMKLGRDCELSLVVRLGCSVKPPLNKELVEEYGNSVPVRLQTLRYLREILVEAADNFILATDLPIADEGLSVLDNAGQCGFGRQVINGETVTVTVIAACTTVSGDLVSPYMRGNFLVLDEVVKSPAEPPRLSTGTNYRVMMEARAYEKSLLVLNNLSSDDVDFKYEIAAFLHPQCGCIESRCEYDPSALFHSDSDHHEVLQDQVEEGASHLATVLNSTKQATVIVAKVESEVLV